MQVYACEDSNQHSGGIVFLTGQILASFPFLFLISISSSLVFYFLVGLRNEFSFMMYFVLNFFMCLLVNEGMVLIVATILQDMFWSISTLVFIHVSFLRQLCRLAKCLKTPLNMYVCMYVCMQVVMMLSAGYFRIRSALPGPVWMYPISYIAFHTYSIQASLQYYRPLAHVEFDIKSLKPRYV